MILNKQNISDWGRTLTPRERQMAYLKSEGKTTSFLASYFRISKCRVYQILTDIKSKLDASAEDWRESDGGYLREILGAAACSLDRERTNIIDREFSTYRGNPNLPFDEEDHFPD